MLGLGGCTHADDGDATGQLGQALLCLLFIPGGVRRLDEVTDLSTALLHGLGAAGTVDNDGLVLRDGDTASGTEVLLTGVAKRNADLGVNDGSTGDHGEIIHEGLAALAKVRRLHGGHLEGLADGVDHEHLQRLAVDILGNDEQRTVRAGDLLQNGQEVRQGAHLVANEQDGRVLQHCLLRVHVGNEVRGKEALVKGHTLGDVECGVDGL